MGIMCLTKSKYEEYHQERVSSITQNAITWTFDALYEVGQYCNGDYYVVGSPDIISISPESVDDGSGRIINGSMINPEVGTDQGLDGEDFGGTYSYDSAMNVGIGISVGSPLSLNPGDSLVSSKSLPTYTDSLISDVAILTCVAEAPVESSFRPPYSGTTKTEYLEASMDYSVLNTLEETATVPMFATLEAYVQKPWLDFKTTWAGDFFHPVNNMPDYGREVASQLGDVALKLNLNYTDAEKRTLLIYMVQIGIDMYALAQSGEVRLWEADGGHGIGRKLPIVFAGDVLNNSEMKNISATKVFSEDDQSFYVTQTDIDLSHNKDYTGSLRDPYAYQLTGVDYTQAMLGMPEFGIRHGTDPSRDSQSWATSYRQCCTMVSLNAHALVALLMGLKAEWNKDDFFDYADRYMAITNGDADPFGYVVADEISGFRKKTDFAEEMWDVYRATII